jgi:hypothetical protein
VLHRKASWPANDAFAKLGIDGLLSPTCEETTARGYTVEDFDIIEAELAVLHKVWTDRAAQHKVWIDREIKTNAQPDAWIRIAPHQSWTFQCQVPPELFEFCHNKEFGGVIFDWVPYNNTVGIKAEPLTWSSNMSNLGIGSGVWGAFACDEALLLKLEAALQAAHSAWTPKPKEGATVLALGKPVATFERLPIADYRVDYHPSLAKSTKIIDAKALPDVMAEAALLSKERTRLVFE